MRLITVFAAALAFTGFASADETAKPERQRPDPEAAFKKLDANSDGGVTLEEFKAGPRAQKDPAKAEARYKKLDANTDGKVTLDEFKTGAQRPGKGGKEGSEKKKGDKKAASKE